MATSASGHSSAELSRAGTQLHVYSTPEDQRHIGSPPQHTLGRVHNLEVRTSTSGYVWDTAWSYTARSFLSSPVFSPCRLFSSRLVPVANAQKIDSESP